MSEDYSPFKMKGNPFTTGGVQGTNSHVSALKKKKEKDIHELVEKRRDLKEKKEKLEERKKEGKKTFLGDARRKRKERQLEKVQEQINANPTAQEWRRKGKKKKSMTKTVGEKPTKGVKGIAKKALAGAKTILEQSKKKSVKKGKKKVNLGNIVDHPDGYSRGQESSILDKIKEKGGKLLKLLKESNRGVAGPFND